MKLANKIEQKRYDEIKKSGKYLELNVLIGVEDDKRDGSIGKLPVVTTCMHDCGQKEIGALYATLQLLTECLENEYPMECLIGNVCMTAQHLGTINTEIEPETNSKGKHSEED